jgi:hypothetical protein
MSDVSELKARTWWLLVWIVVLCCYVVDLHTRIVMIEAKTHSHADAAR